MNRRLNNVLIVDDEPQFVQYYLENLRARGVNPLLLSDFTEARSHVSAHAREYDVIVVDLMEFPRREEPRTGALASEPPTDRPDTSYVERGLAMGRWVMDAIPSECPVVVLTNRDPSKIDWTEEYRGKFAKFKLVTKADCPAYEFHDFLREFLAGGDAGSEDD
jgi:CheY-like chemotaxis protein